MKRMARVSGSDGAWSRGIGRRRSRYDVVAVGAGGAARRRRRRKSTWRGLTSLKSTKATRAVSALSQGGILILTSGRCLAAPGCCCRHQSTLHAPLGTLSPTHDCEDAGAVIDVGPGTLGKHPAPSHTSDPEVRCQFSYDETVFRFFHPRHNRQEAAKRCKVVQPSRASRTINEQDGIQ